jgi:hypothetical protein
VKGNGESAMKLTLRQAGAQQAAPLPSIRVLDDVEAGTTCRAPTMAEERRQDCLCYRAGQRMQQDCFSMMVSSRAKTALVGNSTASSASSTRARAGFFSRS